MSVCVYVRICLFVCSGPHELMPPDTAALVGLLYMPLLDVSIQTARYLHQHQLLAYVDDVNILGGSVQTVKENAEALVVATKEIGLEVNADKTKYMVMSRDRNAGRGHCVKIDNSSIERVEKFKYLVTTLTDQKSIQ